MSQKVIEGEKRIHTEQRVEALINNSQRKIRGERKMSTRKADRTLHRKTYKRVNRKMLVLLTMCMMLGSILFGQQTVWAAPASQTVSDVTVTVWKTAETL